MPDAPNLLTAREEFLAAMQRELAGPEAAVADWPLTDEQAEERERCQASLVEFQRQAWHVVEPGYTYCHNWHIELICEHLEAVSNGEIKRLIINVPPRCEKSLNACVFWPAWQWTRWPWTRWLFTSYSQKLSTRHSLACRRVIQSQWYGGLWGGVFALTSDQNVKTRFDNDRSGYRLATSVGGTTAGEGGDMLVADDPHNVLQAESALRREAVWEWWKTVMSTRLNDPKTGAMVVVMHRVHQRDLTAHLLEQGGWEHVKLPMRYVPRTWVSGIGATDPRTEPGELLWPDHIPEAQAVEMESELGPHGVATQHQQEPYSKSGGEFRRNDFRFCDASQVPVSDMAAWVRYWDKAGTKGGTGPYTAGALLGWHERAKRLYIADVRRGRWDAPEREAEILRTAAWDAEMLGSRMAFTVWLEQEPGSGGKESAQNTVRNLSGYNCRYKPASGDKFVRAGPLAGAVRNGQVTLVRGEWNDAFLDEMEAAGPGAAYLDQMDAAAGGYNCLMAARTVLPTGVVPKTVTRPSYWHVG